MDNITYTQNRELSWLRFNERVLEEAADSSVPLLERLKFTEIFTSNMDEFFMIRVGSLKSVSHINPIHRDPHSGMTPTEQLQAISNAVRPLYAKRDACFFDIVRQLSVHGIHYLRYQTLLPHELKYVKQYFKQSIAPILSPQVVDSHHPFPHLSNHVIYIAARLKYKGKETFGCVPIPNVLPDVLYIPDDRTRIIAVSEIIQAYLPQIFPGYTCLEQVQLRLTRNADLPWNEDCSDFDLDFRQKMQHNLSKRKRLEPVRLELSAPVTRELEKYLCTKTGLQQQEIYITRAPMTLKFAYHLGKQLSPAQRSLLSYPGFEPQLCSQLSSCTHIMKQVQQNDILLSFPYESMTPFLQILKEAANDPAVLSIKITIYRLAGKAKLVDYLCTAAENHKDVTVLIELRARFDEQNNIDWSERLEEAGCRIIYGFEHYKVHSKICLITKKDRSGIRYITQIGTGNYNEKTAAMYTDLSLMTADQEIGQDAAAFFHNMMIGNLNGTYKHLLTAPSSLKANLLSLIDEEIQKGTDGQIVLKMNSITDPQLIQMLRDASKAGVNVILIVRGICCILPEIPGSTSNIHIRSIVGRYLEHSRIYCFGSGPSERMYISSADWMTRNTDHRVEVACPIYSQSVRQKIHHILEQCLSDNIRARQLSADGTYRHITDHHQPMDCQQILMETARSASDDCSAKKKILKLIRRMK